MRVQIRKIGNSLGNIIPAAFIKQLGLAEGTDIEIKVDGGKLTIEPIHESRKNLFPFSEADLLMGLNESTAHADQLAIISSKEIGE